MCYAPLTCLLHIVIRVHNGEFKHNKIEFLEIAQLLGHKLNNTFLFICIPILLNRIGCLKRILLFIKLDRF
jgi:ABC-type sulfate transport system permease component